MEAVGSEPSWARHAAIDVVAAELQPVVGRRAETALTVGIATYDDFDGAYFTVTSLLLHHAEALHDAEILILDNHPRGREAEALATLAKLAGRAVPVRYVPYERVNSTAVRDVLFREASGEIVVVLDTHVLLAPGALRAVVDHLADPAHRDDLVQGPMLADDGVTVSSTQMTPEFSSGMFGVWATDERGLDPLGEAFDIPSQGLAAFAMRRESWPGISPRFRGFGGEEGYVHEKVRQRGGRTVCLPAFRWLHRFLRPRGVPYELRHHDRLHNYLVGWREIGYDISPLLEHFRGLLGPAFASILSEVRTEIFAPLADVDGTVVLIDSRRVAPWIRASTALTQLGRHPHGVVWRDGTGRGLGVALADAIEDAWMRGARAVLVIDEALVMRGADLFALEVAARSVDGGCALFVETEGGDAGDSSGALAGPLLLRDVERLHGKVDELRRLDDPPAVFACLDAQTVHLEVPLGIAEIPAVEIAAGYVPETVPGGRGAWLGSYRGYARLGWARLVHGFRVARPPRETTAVLEVASAVLDPAGAVADGVILLSEGGLWFLRDGGGVLARAMEELDGREWDVVDISSPNEIERRPGDTSVGRPRGAVAGAAFLVNAGSRQKVHDLLSGDMAAGPALTAAFEQGELELEAVWPPIAVRIEDVDDVRTRDGMDTWYERYEDE